MIDTAVALSSRPVGVPAGSAAEALLATDLGALRLIADRAGPDEVAAVLARPRRSLADLAVLLSPAATSRLDDLAAAAHAASLRRFGRVVKLYAPLYLSSECVSTCTYCGFSAANEIARRTLSVDEVRAEAEVLLAAGFRHLLLVAGEHARLVSHAYVTDCLRALAPVVPSLSVETQVWDVDAYERMVAAGCEGLAVYQETYDRDLYAQVHLKGKKRNYDWRLAALDRGAQAGMRSLAVGALLGLHGDWRREVLAVAAHAQALTIRWWRCEVSVSLPRLRPAAGHGTGNPPPPTSVDDASFVQVVCALRLALPDVGIAVSTRESPTMRDGLVRLGVTAMSAGSRTEPGGYLDPAGAEPQFEVSDERSPAQIAEMLRFAGYETVWRDTIGARRQHEARAQP